MNRFQKKKNPQVRRTPIEPGFQIPIQSTHSQKCLTNWKITDLGCSNRKNAQMTSHLENQIPPEEEPGLPIWSLPAKCLESRRGDNFIIPIGYFFPNEFAHRWTHKNRKYLILTKISDSNSNSEIRGSQVKDFGERRRRRRTVEIKIKIQTLEISISWGGIVFVT